MEPILRLALSLDVTYQPM